ncbi:MAG: helix-turn-helix domain-containing protein [Salinirussus sp.]
MRSTNRGGHILAGESHGEQWQFTLQFPDHHSVSVFNERIRERNIEEEVLSVENPWVIGVGSDTELTDAQREALALAHRHGYFEIPRRISTKALADKLGISDQAMSERLRRGIDSMIESAVSMPEPE